VGEVGEVQEIPEIHVSRRKHLGMMSCKPRKEKKIVTAYI
jgi:hypothetical protein